MMSISAAASSFVAAVVASSSLFGSATASMMSYDPLLCNVDIHSCDIASATPLSTIIAAGTDSSSHVTVPCNTCAYVDYTDGEIITLPNGIDVVGRLIFPPSANVEIKLKALFVQGMLDMVKPDGDNQIVVSLYGEDEITFYPHESTGLDGVNIGAKPIVVAGGQLNIDAVDANCPSWTRLTYKVSNTQLKVDPEFASCVNPGDELLISSSTTKWDDDKKVSIASVDSITGVIDIETPIVDVLPGVEKTTIPSCFNGTYLVCHFLVYLFASHRLFDQFIFCSCVYRY